MRGDSWTEDLLQDIWFDVFRGVSRLANPAAFLGWLYRIARARVCRELRQCRHTFCPLDEATLGREPTLEFSEEDAADVRRALDELPEEQREVLVLRFLQEMSYADIALAVDSPVGTVRSRIHYAKQALRSVMEREERDN
jgi:RNA polymerase sigma-70 factor (ECF subfamily)